MRRYRTFWPRFLAGFVDGLVFIPVEFIESALVDPANPNGFVIAGGLVGLGAYPLYSVLLHARYGATLGKMATGVKVLNLEETDTPTLRQALLRDLPIIIINAYIFVSLLGKVRSGTFDGTALGPDGAGDLIVNVAGLWFVLELVTMLMSSKRRALHDLLAGTVVVRQGVPRPR